MRRALISSNVLLGIVRHLQHVSSVTIENLTELGDSGAMDLLLTQASADREVDEGVAAEKIFRTRDLEKSKTASSLSANQSKGGETTTRFTSISDGQRGSTSFAYPSMGGALTKDFTELAEDNASMDGSFSPPMLSPATPLESEGALPNRRSGRTRKRAGTMLNNSMASPVNGDVDAAAALQRLASSPNAIEKSHFLGYGNFGKVVAERHTKSAKDGTLVVREGPFPNHHGLGILQHQVDCQREAEKAYLAEKRRRVVSVVAQLSSSIESATIHVDKVFVDWLQKLVSVAQEAQDDSIFTSGTNIDGAGQSASQGDLGLIGESSGRRDVAPWDTVTALAASHQTQASPASCFEAVLRTLPALFEILVQLHNIPTMTARTAESAILTFVYRVVVSLAEFPETLERAVGPDTYVHRDYDTLTEPHLRSQQSQKVSFKGMFAQIVTPHLPFLLTAATLQMKAIQRGEVSMRSGPPITLFTSAAVVDSSTGLREVIPNVVSLTVADDYFWVTTFTISVIGGDAMASFLVSRRKDATDDPFQELLVHATCSCLGYAIKTHCNRIMRLSGLLDDISQPPLPLPSVTSVVSSTTMASKSRSLLKVLMDEGAFMAHMLRTLAKIALQLPVKMPVSTIVGTLSVASWLAMTMAGIDPNASIPLRYAGDEFNPPQQGPMAPLTRMILQSTTVLASTLASTTPESFLPFIVFAGCQQQAINAVVMLFVAWNFQISHQTSREHEASRRRAHSEAELGARSVRTISALSELPADEIRHSEMPPAAASNANKAYVEFQKHQPALIRILIKLLARQGPRSQPTNDPSPQPAGAQRLFAETAEESEYQRQSCRCFLRAMAEAHHLAKINERRLTNAVDITQLRSSEGSDCFALLSASLKRILLDSTQNVRTEANMGPFSYKGHHGGGGPSAANHYHSLSEVWHVNMWRECLRIATLHSHLLGFEGIEKTINTPSREPSATGSATGTLSALTMLGGISKVMQSPSPDPTGSRLGSMGRDAHNNAPIGKGQFASLASSVDLFEAYWNLAATALRSIDDSSDGSMLGHQNSVGSLVGIVGAKTSMGNRMGLSGISNARNAFSSQKGLKENDDWSDYASWMAKAQPSCTGGAESLLSQLASQAATVRSAQQKAVDATALATLAKGALCGELVASIRYLDGCIALAISSFDADRHPATHRVCNGFELAAEYLATYAHLIAKTASIPSTFARYFHESSTAMYYKAIERVDEEPQKRGSEISPTLRSKIVANLKRRIVENEIGVAL